MTRSLWMVVALCGCTAADAAPTAQSAAGYYHARDFGITGTGDESAKVNAALATLPAASTFDFDGLSVTANVVIPASAGVIGQSRLLTIRGCTKLTAATAAPVFRMADSVAAYFLTIEDCFLKALTEGVRFDRMFESEFLQVWVTGPADLISFHAIGTANGNIFQQVYTGGAVGVKAEATGGASSGPNSNRIRDSRFQSATGVWIGESVQDWIIEGSLFETCTVVCVRLDGTRLLVAAQNRMECAGPLGIILGPRSDGTIGTQYWSSCLQRIGADPAEDIAAWRIDTQPGPIRPGAAP
jgi:hypothetical protein